MSRKVVAEHVAGWATTTEEHNVFVLPAKGNQVLSPICPHEGCEVLWEQDRNRFACPCHESYFAADGAKISGPSPRGMDQLPSRVQDGKLQVQYGLPPDGFASEIQGCTSPQSVPNAVASGQSRAYDTAKGPLRDGPTLPRSVLTVAHGESDFSGKAPPDQANRA